jgi:hypothetical protein
VRGVSIKGRLARASRRTARSLSAAAILTACATTSAPDPGLEGLHLSTVAPQTIVPGTKLVVTGESFVADQWGAGTLHLVGGHVDVRWPVAFVDFNTVTVAIDAGKLGAIGANDFTGTAEIEYVAASDGQTYTSNPLSVALSFRDHLQPAPSAIAGGVIFVNDQIEVDGDGFLLGGDEGTSYARVAGCFTLDSDTSGTCTPIAQADIAMTPNDPLARTKATFPFSPKLVGIQPGTFTGTVTIVNKQAGGFEGDAAAIAVNDTLVTAQIFSADPPAASLGQYVFVRGGGFVGGEPGALTVVEISGQFTKTGAQPVNVTMQLVPEFVEGRLVRYVLNTDDALGHALDLRNETGSFSGTATPIVSYGNDTVRGVATQIAFAIAPVKQIIYLRYDPAYVEELRDFGLRAVDQQIRARILAVVNEAYKGVNIEFRADPPTDFALFSSVALVGVDPNNMGLFGYDNSPGKDNGNVRLYDELGGVNAVTQQDGYPGFGGVFVRSFMAFSQHPGSFAMTVPGADPAFDQTFDPFRADRHGQPVIAADVASLPPALADGGACPAQDRPTQIACAIFVLGNLIGNTLAHEIGHSLGLANPYMDGFHNAGATPNRMMNAGGDRPFLERAELHGQGPEVFCDDEYVYLRKILPSSQPSNDVPRPGCF